MLAAWQWVVQNFENLNLMSLNYLSTNGINAYLHNENWLFAFSVWALCCVHFLKTSRVHQACAYVTAWIAYKIACNWPNKFLRVMGCKWAWNRPHICEKYKLSEHLLTRSMKYCYLVVSSVGGRRENNLPLRYSKKFFLKFRWWGQKRTTCNGEVNDSLLLLQLWITTFHSQDWLNDWVFNNQRIKLTQAKIQSKVQKHKFLTNPIDLLKKESEKYPYKSIMALNFYSNRIYTLSNKSMKMPLILPC